MGTNSAMNVAGGGGGDTQKFDYGCARDAYNTWCKFVMDPGYDKIGPDNTTAFRGGSTHYLYQLKMKSDRAGFFVWRSQEPCPSSCASPTATYCTFTGSNVDFPTLLWDATYDKMYFSYLKDDHIKVGRLNDPFCSGGWNNWADPCLPGDMIRTPRAAVDAAGRIHIVFENRTAGRIQHHVFDPSTNTFDACSRIKDVSDYLPPAPHCGSCTENTYYGLGSACLAYGSDLGIAIDKSTGTLVVTLSAHGSGSCSQKQEQRIYRSTDDGQSWHLRLVTGCNTSIMDDVRYDQVPEHGWTPGLFQARSSYNPPGSQGLAEVRWRSGDDGITWGGIYITPTRSVTAPIHANNCYWGDYNGLAADPANQSFFYSFGNGDYGPDWVIRAKAQNE